MVALPMGVNCAQCWVAFDVAFFFKLNVALPQAAIIRALVQAGNPGTIFGTV